MSVIATRPDSSAKLFDAHCHLQDSRIVFDLEQALARARRAGVEGFLCCGVSETDWQSVRDIRAGRPEVFAAYGLHPWYAAQRTGNWLSRLRRMLESEPRAAVGETGLDHAAEYAGRGDQDAVFAAQLELAAELQRPVTIHCRKAWESLVEILDRVPSRPAKMMIHSYSGSADLVPELAARGACFSFSGSITRSGNKRGRKAIAAVPLERLLIETDSPDIVPVGVERPEAPNEPANLLLTAQCAAELLGISPEALARATWENAAAFLGLSGAAAGADEQIRKN